MTNEHPQGASHGLLRWNFWSACGLAWTTYFVVYGLVLSNNEELGHDAPFSGVYAEVWFGAGAVAGVASVLASCNNSVLRWFGVIGIALLALLRALYFAASVDPVDSGVELALLLVLSFVCATVSLGKWIAKRSSE